jgi:hypothetical protein
LIAIFKIGQYALIVETKALLRVAMRQKKLGKMIVNGKELAVNAIKTMR